MPTLRPIAAIARGLFLIARPTIPKMIAASAGSQAMKLTKGITAVMNAMMLRISATSPGTFVGRSTGGAGETAVVGWDMVCLPDRAVGLDARGSALAQGRAER